MPIGSALSDREALAAALLKAQGVVVSDASITILRLGGWPDGQADWREALETADTILAAGFSRNGPATVTGDEDALAVVLDLIGEAIEASDTGLHVEHSDTGLVVSWPVTSSYPFRPGIPDRIRIVATQEPS